MHFNDIVCLYTFHILYYSKKGTNIAVPLREKCNKNPVNSVTTSMLKSTANTHVTNITTTISATNTLAATLDATGRKPTLTGTLIYLVPCHRHAKNIHCTECSVYTR